VVALVAVLSCVPRPTRPRSGWRARLDEYFSWLVVLMPLLTGMFAFPTLGRRVAHAPLRRSAPAHLLSSRPLILLAVRPASRICPDAALRRQRLACCKLFRILGLRLPVRGAAPPLLRFALCALSTDEGFLAPAIRPHATRARN